MTEVLIPAPWHGTELVESLAWHERALKTGSSRDKESLNTGKVRGDYQGHPNVWCVSTCSLSP